MTRAAANMLENLVLTLGAGPRARDLTVQRWRSTSTNTAFVNE